MTPEALGCWGIKILKIFRAVPEMVCGRGLGSTGIILAPWLIVELFVYETVVLRSYIPQ